MEKGLYFCYDEKNPVGHNFQSKELQVFLVSNNLDELSIEVLTGAGEIEQKGARDCGTFNSFSGWVNNANGN